MVRPAAHVSFLSAQIFRHTLENTTAENKFYENEKASQAFACSAFQRQSENRDHLRDTGDFMKAEDCLCLL